jgi:ubiquinone/menaquinone biosynthesis C-methylase UbiE
MLDIKKSWDKIAGLYRDSYPIDPDIIHYGPLCPGENKLNLLGNISGLKAIDLGCGGGQNVVAMAKAGVFACGVDFSERQLIHARNLAAKKKVDVEWINGDVTALPMLKDSSFDLAFTACAFAFVKRLDLALNEAYRIVRPGGRFVLAVMHPMQYIIDGDEGTMYFNSTYPFSPRVLKWTWDFPEKSIWFQHYLRSISEYHNCLAEAGFTVRKIIEPKPTLNTPHLGISKEIMKEYPYIAEHLPITLIFLCYKYFLAESKEHNG